jgi:CheY-like chemotaxis protein
VTDGIRTLLIDESMADLRIAQRLSNVGLPCEPLRPPADIGSLQETLDRTLSNDEYDAVLLDYRLDEEMDEELGRPNYRGGTLAAWIKEKFPHVPVILVTTEAKLEDWLANNPTVRTLFDLEVMKRDLLGRKDRTVVAEGILDLISGFKAIDVSLQSVSNQLSTVLQQVMEATPEEAEAIARLHVGTASPLMPELVRWLMNDVLLFPGPVLDEEEVRVRLGLTRSGFNRKGIREWLAPAAYTGAFRQLRVRWWRGRIENLLAQGQGDEAVGTASERAQAVSRAADVRVRPESCTWCGGLRISRACAICHQAVDPTHCLPANLDERPSWADAAVVCFVCIETGRADGVVFAPTGERVASRVRKGEISREPTGV